MEDDIYDELENWLSKFFSNSTGWINFTDPSVSDKPGNWTVTNGEDEMGSWEQRRYQSDDGSVQMVSFTRTSTPEEITRQEQIMELKRQEAEAVINEDFDAAIEARDKIKSLSAEVKHEDRLKAFYEKKARAIRERDYETVKEINSEIEDFLASIKDVQPPNAGEEE